MIPSGFNLIGPAPLPDLREDDALWWNLRGPNGSVFGLAIHSNWSWAETQARIEVFAMKYGALLK